MAEIIWEILNSQAWHWFTIPFKDHWSELNHILHQRMLGNEEVRDKVSGDQESLYITYLNLHP